MTSTSITYNLFIVWDTFLGGSAVKPYSVKPVGILNEVLFVHQAMSALVCCGPCFAPAALAEDGSLYPWINEMLSSTNDKVSWCLILWFL